MWGKIAVKKGNKLTISSQRVRLLNTKQLKRENILKRAISVKSEWQTVLKSDLD